MDWYALLTDDGERSRVWWLDQYISPLTAAHRGLLVLDQKTSPPFQDLVGNYQITLAPLDCLCAPSSDDETLSALFRMRLNRDVVVYREDGPWKVSTIHQFLDSIGTFLGKLARGHDWAEGRPHHFRSDHPRIKHHNRFELAAWELWRESEGDQA